MSNNDFENDPLDPAGLDGDTGFEDFESGEASARDMFRNSPMVKIGVVLGAIATIVGGIVLFGGGDKAQNTSVMRPGSDLSEAPGSAEVTDVYRKQIEDFNRTQIDIAKSQGDSALPVPVGTARGKILDEQAKTTDEDPLERWRRLQAERIEKEKQAAPPAPDAGPPVDPNAKVKQDLAKAMAGQMESILETKKIKEAQLESVSDPDWIDQKRKQAQREKETEAKAEANEAGSMQTPVAILLPAGTVEYAQLLTEANTDAPGPILAQIVSGPLAGSRAIGSFKASDEYITLQFDTVVVDGIAYGTDAIALDPKTANPGMITEIDKKYFTRIIIPAAAAFIEGLGGAIAESGSTTVTVSSSGSAASSSTEDLDPEQEFFKAVEEAADKAGEILEEDAESVKPMLRVAAGTPMAMFFVEAVEKRTLDDEDVAEEENQMNAFGQLVPAFISVPATNGIAPAGGGTQGSGGSGTSTP